MLIKQVHLQGIESGNISLAFRKWDKASVKKGTLLKTSIGLVEVTDITIIEESKITERDALNAGFESKMDLLKSLRPNSQGRIYKIQLSYHSPDPRIQLREQTLTDEMYAGLKEKLVRFDKSSKQGPWTRTILLAIKSHSHVHAIKIAEMTGFEKAWLKPNIRKLKDLGLTISHTVGYELSPLGNMFVIKLLDEE